MRVQYVARLIVQTPFTALANSTLAVQFMKSLRDMLHEDQALAVGATDAEELLTKLIIIFAPVARLAESVVCTLLIISYQKLFQVL